MPSAPQDIAENTERPGTELVRRVEIAAPKQIDTSLCMTYDLVSTSAADRMGDILVAAGCDTSEHRLHPVILFNHGRSGDAYGQLPIGTAVDKSGSYGVTVLEDGVYSWSRYAQSSPFAMQLFALTAEGVLRGNSVAGDPIPGFTKELPRRKLYDGRQSRCFQHNRWILREFSKTPGPVNPEALTILVEKGRANGEALNPILKSYLTPLCSRGPELVPGWRFEKATGAMAMKCDHCGGEHATADCKETAEDRKKREDASASVEKAMKPTLKVMAAVMQLARDSRAVIAKAAADELEDEMALATCSEADGYLEQIERACYETLIAKGIATEDAPAVVTAEIFKATTPDKLPEIGIRGYRSPGRLVEIHKAIPPTPAPTPALPVDPAELAQTRRLAASTLRRARATA